jgi:hypothetical protein
MPEITTSPVDVPPAQADFERALHEARELGRVRREALAMEVPPPAEDEGWPPKVVEGPLFPAEPSPWPKVDAPHPCHSPGQQQWTQLLEHLLENPPPRETCIAAGESARDVGQQLATLRADALARARANFAASEAAAELTAARDALGRAEEFQRQVAAEHREAAAALRRAVEAGQANGKPAGRVAAAAATLGTVAGVVKDAGGRLQRATAAARAEWQQCLALEERAIHEGADTTLAEVVARFHETFAAEAARFIHSQRVLGGGRLLAGRDDLSHAEAALAAGED